VGVLEEGGAVVENEVDTSELLPSLEGNRGPGPHADAVASVAEAIEV
jgi:hypothetical protein